jgi:hypothetical protein
MRLSRVEGSLTKFSKDSARHVRYIMRRVRETPCLCCHLSAEMSNTATARRLRHQRLANACDLVPLLSNSSKLPLPNMTTRHDTNAGRSIRADSPSPPSSRRANKILRVRIYRRSHGAHVTLPAGHPGKSQRTGANHGPRQKRAVSEREATRLDWMRRLRPKPHRRC